MNPVPPDPSTVPNPGRRRLLRAALLAGAAAAGWPLAERFLLRLEEADVPLPGLPPALDGLRIALLSDIHVGHFAGPELAEEAVALANRGRPDLAVIAGDVVHDGVSRGALAATARALAGLRAPLGVYAVLGNHDYAAGGRRVRAALEDAGVPVLVNAGRRLQVRGHQLWLAGVDDCWNGHPDLDRALRGAGAQAVRLLVVHEPDFADQAVRRAGDSLHLQLSGHSHGGQVRLPLIGALHLPYMAQRYPIGLQPVAGHRLQVYTSRGIGVTGPPVRLFCPPEVALLRLRRTA